MPPRPPTRTVARPDGQLDRASILETVAIPKKMISGVLGFRNSERQFVTLRRRTEEELQFDFSLHFTCVEMKD